jgi:hypothetical protein
MGYNLRKFSLFSKSIRMDFSGKQLPGNVRKKVLLSGNKFQMPVPEKGCSNEKINSGQK